MFVRTGRRSRKRSRVAPILNPPLGALPHLVHETLDRFLLGVCIQLTSSDLTTNLAVGKIELPLPALDFVAKELETIPDMYNPCLLRM